MLGVHDQAQVQQPRFLLGVALVGAKHAQKVLRSGKVLPRVVQVEASSLKYIFVDRISVRGNHRHPCHQLHALPQHVGKTVVIRGIVIRVERQHPGCHFVHDGGGGGLHQDILIKARRQLCVKIEQLMKMLQL